MMLAYPVSAFPGGKILSVDNLDASLRGALPGIYDGLTMDGTDVFFKFLTDLSPEQISVVDGIVENNQYLNDYKLAKINSYRQSIRSFIFSHYSAGTQSTLHGLMAEAQVLGYQERRGKLLEIFTWLKSVLSYYDDRVAHVMSAQDGAEIDAVPLNLAQFVASRPPYTRQELQSLTQ